MRRMKAFAIATAILAGFAVWHSVSGQPKSVDEVMASGLVAATPAFAEEFDRKENLQAWGHVFDDPSQPSHSVLKRTLPSNRERQVFFDRAYLGLGLDPFDVRDGALTISAAPLERHALIALNAEIDTLRANQVTQVLRELRYSSGMITQRGRFAQRYGYFEVRMRWTGGRGVWPAFWLLREDSHWPPEIDVVEALGHEPQKIYSSIHSAYPQRDVTRPIAFAGNPGEFHTFGALWLPDRVDYYVDRRKTASIPTKADMDRPMYPLVSLAIGGNWPGDPDASTMFPAMLDVDYVRIWPLAVPASGS